MRASDVVDHPNLARITNHAGPGTRGIPGAVAKTPGMVKPLVTASGRVTACSNIAPDGAAAEDCVYKPSNNAVDR